MDIKNDQKKYSEIDYAFKKIWKTQFRQWKKLDSNLTYKDFIKEHYDIDINT